MADQQYGLSKVMPSRRGKIFFQDKFGARITAAEDSVVKTLIAAPKNIEDPVDAAEKLSGILGIRADILREQLQKPDDPYELIAKDLPEDTAKKVADLKMAGLSLQATVKRYYPHKELAAHVLGFRGYNDALNDWRGVYGVEKEYDRDLASGGITPDEFATNLLFIGRRTPDTAPEGTDVLLTIDYNIQERAEEELQSLVPTWVAESGMVLILEPRTGRILASASSKKFDPNEYFNVEDYSVFTNPVVEATYELGSVFKPITMAAAVNEGVVNGQSTYYDEGVLKFGSYSIYNFDLRSYGTQTMTQVLEKSLNTGAVHVERLLGKERFKKYVEAFGFGETTDSDLPNEVSGTIANLNSNRDLEYATASFGQGIAVTPIQMAQAVGAIANGGVRMRPHVVDGLIDESGTVRAFEPEARGQVISKEAAEEITKMLVSVVRVGYENRAGVQGYFVAGKTGTAQIPNAESRGYSSDVIHSFVGYAPAFNPKFLVYMQLTKPQGNRFAANTLTRAFHNLAEFILNYYEIPPDEK